MNRIHSHMVDSRVIISSTVIKGAILPSNWDAGQSSAGHVSTAESK